MFRAWAIAIAAMLLIAAIPIPKPSPSDQAPSEQKNAETQGHNQQSASEIQTSSKPLLQAPIVITNILRTGAEDQRKHNHQSQPDAGKSFWDFTLTDVLLVIFTGALVWVGNRQWKAMIGQDLRLKESIDKAEAASERQSADTQTQIALSRAEFLSTHRPKIILREAIIGSVLEGEPIKVMMRFANTGETGGTIVRSVVDLRVVPTVFEIPLFNNSVEPFDELGQIELGPGAATLIPWERLQKRPNSPTPPKWEKDKFIEFEEAGIKKRRARIHLVGEFIYADGSDPPTLRRTRFCRVLIPEKQRFYRIRGEPDLDYAD